MRVTNKTNPLCVIFNVLVNETIVITVRTQFFYLIISLSNYQQIFSAFVKPS